MKEFRGIYVIGITPMNENEEIDILGLKNNIDWYIENKVSGICLLGSSGEFVSLSKEERLMIAEAAVEHINGRVPFILGTTAETTKETIEYTRHAKKVGADGALILNPYYCKPTESEIFEHFKAVSDAVNIPIMLYNNPFTSGIDMKPELIAKISQLENIKYVKESSMEIRRVRDIVRNPGSSIKVFCGAEDLALESFISGAVGWISVCANIIPQEAQQLFDLVQTMEYEKAKELYYRMLPLLEFLENSGKLVQVVKTAMNKMGLAAGVCRLPRLPLTSKEETKLNKILEYLLLKSMK